ncbi:RING finger protein 224 [Frankliniella fusca]|uniref:RING finger protein 224 n=1 Tax=Frankliniella fusca TaxID=407009 RepID=A0AAE1GXN4_9NEOP|nr:RING finger protein 224 [Frankliniella fusca]
MECFRCDRPYDLEAHRPKLLPCGHTFCSACLQGAGECFSDSTSFPGAACLPDDVYTLALVTGDIRRHPDDPEPGQLQLWCRGCAAAARDACVDGGHELVTGRQRWHEQVLDGLERLAAALEEAGDPEEQDDQLDRLVASAGVGVTLSEVDGEDQWQCKVQLGGSGEEDTVESWALRALLMEALREHPGAREDKEESVFPLVDFVEPPDTPPGEALAVLDLGPGLFDQPQRKGPSGRYRFPLDDDSDDDEARDAGMSALAEEEEDPDEQLRMKEELRVRVESRERLFDTLRRPGLRRLEVWAGSPATWRDPFRVPPLPDDVCGLESLKVYLNPSTAASLIYAHNRTLRTVQIVHPERTQIGRLPGAHFYFESLDYLGDGRIGQHVFRSPYFPRRLPGDFPVLERVEFLDKPRDPHYHSYSWITGKDLDLIERLLPGVEVKLVFDKRPFWAR